MSNLNIVLFGCNDFSVKVADELVKINSKPKLIIGSEEKFKISYSKKKVKNIRYVNMKDWSNLNNCQYYHFKDNDSFNKLEILLKELDCDLGIVAGWYNIIPKSIRCLFKKDIIGFHASLLPKLRGGAPLNWAILKGFSETGISCFSLNGEVDSGNLYKQVSIKIEKEDHIQDLINKIETASIKIIPKIIRGFQNSTIKSYLQKGKPSYGLQRKPLDSLISWFEKSAHIEKLVRASSRPYSGAFCYFEGKKIYIWRCSFLPLKIDIYGVPGQIINIKNVSLYPLVITNDGYLEIKEATFENKIDAISVLKKSSHKRFEYYN